MDPDVMAMLQKSISAKVFLLLFCFSSSLTVPPSSYVPQWLVKLVWMLWWTHQEREIQASPAGKLRLTESWSLLLSEPSLWQRPSTRSRGLRATLWWGPCTLSLRSTCPRRRLLPPRRQAWQLMHSMPLPCWRPPVSASFLALGLVKGKAPSTLGRPSLLRRTSSGACLAGELFSILKPSIKSQKATLGMEFSTDDLHLTGLGTSTSSFWRSTRTRPCPSSSRKYSHRQAHGY